MREFVASVKQMVEDGSLAELPSMWEVSQHVLHAPPATLTIAAQLDRLTQLRDSGALTEEEFTAAKATTLVMI